MTVIKDAIPKFKVGDIVTCSFPFREKEANVIRTVTDVFPERDKRYGNIIDFYVSADGGSTGKPINLVQEMFFSLYTQNQNSKSRQPGPLPL